MLQTTGAAIAAATGLGIASTGSGVAQSSGPDIDVTIGFDDSSYLDRFSQSYRTEYNAILEANRADSDTSLGVQFADGDHWGTSMRYRFSEEGYDEPETLYYQYDVYFPTDFEVVENGGKLPGPAGTYDTAGWGGRESDGTNGWSARMSFTPGSDSSHVQVGWYCYHADMGGWGDNWDWSKNDAGNLTKGEWHEITGEVTMNTPEENDGVLRGWVDGDLAFEKTDIRFRDTTDLKVQDFWFNAYYGGSWASPSDNEIRFDNLRLMTDINADSEDSKDSYEHTIVFHADPDNPVSDDAVPNDFDLKVTTTGAAAFGEKAESDSDEVYSNSDGTTTIRVNNLLPDEMDSFHFDGKVVDYVIDDGYALDVSVDGRPTTLDDLVDGTFDYSGETSDSTSDGSSDSNSLSNVIVVDGQSASDTTTYTFTVTGTAERDIVESEGGDTGFTWSVVEDVSQEGKVMGIVGDGVDVFQFSGKVTDLTVDGDADIYIERDA